VRTKLRDGEEPRFLVRRHWIIFARPMAAIAVTLSLLYGIRTHGWDEFMDVALWAAMGAVCWAVYTYLDWKTNVWAVTSERVIDEWGIISRNAKESPLDRINNVSYTQSIIGRILGFGDVEIQTAASEGSTMNRMVNSPKLLQEAITKAQGNYGITASKPGAAAQKEEAKNDLMECPWCAEPIKAKARICRYCGREINRQAAPSQSNGDRQSKNVKEDKTLPRERPKTEKWSRFRK